MLLRRAPLSALTLVLTSCGPRPLRITTPMVRELEPACAPAGIDACKIACDTGDGAACLAVAGAYEYGRGAPYDEDRMVDYERLACAHGLGLGCLFLAGNPAVDLTTRFDAAASGCELGSDRACEGAYWLAVDRVAHEGAPFGLVDHSLERACATSPRLCAPLADLERMGIERSVNDAEADRLYRIACTAGSQIACENVGETDRPTLSLAQPILFSDWDISRAPMVHTYDVGPLPDRSDVTYRGRLCFGEDGAFQLETVESSGMRSFDHAIRKDSASWTFVHGRYYPVGREFCMTIRFKRE